MADWYECRIKYETIVPNGKNKPTTELYLIDAVSFTEAETRLHKILKDEINADFTISGIRPVKLTEIVESQSADPKWYKSKVVYIDEIEGKEKRVGHFMYVAGNNISEALENLDKSQSSILIPYEIETIGLTKIIDIFPFNAN